MADSRILQDPARANRSGLVLSLGMVAAVGGVIGLAYVDLRREQARAIDDFAAEQSALARASASAIAARLAGVRRHLALLADVADPLDAVRLAASIGRDDPRYAGIEVRDGAGRPLGPRSATVTALGATADDALGRARDGVMTILPAEGAGRGDPANVDVRLCAFRTPARTLLLALPTSSLFGGMGAVTEAMGPTPARWLVVDDAGRVVQLDPRDPGAFATGDEAHTPDLRALLDEMRAGRSGAHVIGRDEARSLGLEPRLAVAGYAPIELDGGRRWSVAVVASARRVRDRSRVAAWRLGAATTLAALAMGLFGVGLRRLERRALTLSEALRLAEATASLRERSEKLVEAIPVGVLALDRAGVVTTANPFLLERGVVAGKRLAEALAGAPPEDVEQLEALLREARSTGRVVSRPDLRLRLGGGEAAHLDVSAAPLLRPLPDVDCFLVLHDRTELRSLERKLSRADKLATIGTLAAGIAHEVGTPLGIISGRAEQLLARPDAADRLDDGARKSLSSILAQVEKVSKIIRQLLDFARVRPVEVRAVPPGQALESARALLEHRFRQAGVAAVIERGDGVPPVAADPGQLEQVLVNLLLNACDACRAGGRVVGRTSARPGSVQIDVVDDGCGIAPEHLPHVLDPFFTTKKRGQGTGLGLSIAADIVKNHGGTIEIDSAVGAGTTVRVVLPAAEGGDDRA